MNGHPESSLARYESSGELARGGMGVVLKVHDCELDRTLAMKRMLQAPNADGGASEVDRFARFMEEAHVTAQLDHPGIVPVYDLGTDDDGTAWYTMKMVRGRELSEVIVLARQNRDGWNLSRLVGVLVKICQTMAFAHGKGVIHRDLKPANIMVGDLGEVYVMDWGLARQLGRDDVRDIRLKLGDELARSGMETIASPRMSNADSSLDTPLMTMDGAIIGTPAYMPPEQAAGIVDQVDHLSDIYSLGAILYEALADAPPYRDTTVTAKEVITALSNGPPTPVRQIRRNAPVELAAICEKAMSRVQEDRYQTSLELAEDLQAFIDGQVVRAHRTGAIAEAKKWIARNKGTAVAIAFVIASLVTLAALQTISKKKVEAALGKEAEALKETQVVLSDSYAKFGFEEAEKGELGRAKLWFHEAARLSESDPVRRRANLMRAKTYGEFAPQLLRVMTMPEKIWSVIRCHHALPIAIFQSRNVKMHFLVDLDRMGLLPIKSPKKNYVYGAAFEPNGMRVAVSPSAGKLSILQLPEGAEVATYDFGEEVGTIERIAWSESGLLFLGSQKARIFDLNAEKIWPAVLDHQFENRDRELRGIHTSNLSENGKYLITTAHYPNYDARLFSLNREDSSATLLWKKKHSGSRRPEFIDGGTWVCLSTKDKVVIVDSLSGKIEVEFVAGNPPKKNIPEAILKALDENPQLGYELDKKYLFFPKKRKKAVMNLPARVLSVEDKSITPLPESSYAISGFLSQGREPIAVTRSDRQMQIVRFPQDERFWEIPSSREAIPVFSPCGKFVTAKGLYQKELQVYEIKSRKPVGEKMAPSEALRLIAFSAENVEEVVATIGEKELRRLNWRTGEKLGPTIHLPSTITAILCHQEMLYATLESGEVWSGKLENGKLKLLFKGQSNRRLDTLRITESGEGELLIATCCKERTRAETYFWDVSKGKFKYPPLAHGNGANWSVVDIRENLFLSPYGTHILDLFSGDSFTSPVKNNTEGLIVFGRNSDTVLVTGRTPTTRVLNWKTGEPACPDLPHGFRDNRWFHRALSIPGTPWVVVSGMNGVRFFEVDSGRPIAPPITWPESTRLWILPKVAISADRKTFAHNDGTEGLRMVDLSALIEEPKPTDLELDQLDAGATIVPGGLSNMTPFKERPERWKAWLEKNRDHPRLKLE